MSFSVSDATGDFEYSSASPNGLFAKRAHLVTPWFHRMVADLARFNRAARELLEQPGNDISLGAWLEQRALLARVRRAPDRPAGLRRVVGRSRQRWNFPARFLAEFFDNHGVLSIRGRPRWRTVSGGSARYVEALTRPFAQPPAARNPRVRDRAPARPRARHRARLRTRALRRSRDRDALRPGAGRCWRTPPTPSSESSARSPTSATTPSCTRMRACCRGAAAPGRAGTITSSSVPVTAATVTYHMNRLQSLQRRRAAVRDAEPHGRDRSRAGASHDQLRPSRVHPGGSQGPAARAGDQRPQPDQLLRRVLGLGLSRGRSRQRGCAWRSASGDACDRQLHLRGNDPPPPAGAAARVPPSPGALVRRSRRAARAARRPSAGDRRPARCASAGATTTAIRRCR